MQNSMQTFLLTTIIMFINSLRTSSFRNLADVEINTHSKDVFLVGENGQGKTNFLEALYFSAYASSFRSVKDNDIIRNGNSAFSAAVKLTDTEILIKFENGKKLVFINGKKAQDRKELLSITPTIVFCHEDMEFVSGTPERRRWFFDQTLSLYDPVYLDDLRRYKRVLKSRNTVLRDFHQKKHEGGGSIEQVLDALDPQLAEYGQKLMEKRINAACDFSGVFAPLYEKVSGIEGITVQYIRSWKSENNILEHLRQRRYTDIAAGISLSGPHRDKYIFTDSLKSGNQEFTVKASTGQKRLLALLLRTAQARRFSEVTGQHPVLLLDDVLLEMDGEKRRRFLEVLPEYKQAFYTFLSDEPYNNYRKDDTLVYKVKDGMVFI